MRRVVLKAVTIGAILACPIVPAAAATAAEQAPSAAQVVARALDAAGGLAAFQALGILEVDIAMNEVTQDGHTISSSPSFFLVTPGPTPGRFEYPASQTIAGDDGTGGWALLRGKPDARPLTQLMVKRLIRSTMFPILLPFSLTWQKVEVTSVLPAEVSGKPVWRLKIQLPRTFFHTPQIANTWMIDVDRQTYQVVRADSPYTDLGRGIRADGMRFTWSNPIKLEGVWLPGEQRVTGLDEAGNEKTHSRTDRFHFRVLPDSEAAKLFSNPVPPGERPRLNMPQPPPNLAEPTPNP
jgi:hypothetical protein